MNIYFYRKPYPNKVFSLLKFELFFCPNICHWSGLEQFRILTTNKHVCIVEAHTILLRGAKIEQIDLHVKEGQNPIVKNRVFFLDKTFKPFGTFHLDNV